MEKKENITDDEIIQLQTIKKAERSKYIQDKIRLQNEEISKTNNLIIKFQEILADQKNMLFKLTEELKTVLTDDEINKLNYVDHDGIENMIEDSPKLQDTDLRIIQPHTTENENRKRKMPQELIINEIEDEISDISSLDSWSSQKDLSTTENIHKECEQELSINLAVSAHLKRLLVEKRAESKSLRQENADLMLKHAILIEKRRTGVPRSIYDDAVNELEKLLAEHQMCLQNRHPEDQQQFSLLFGTASIVPQPAALDAQTAKNHSLRNRRRKERKLKQRLIREGNNYAE